MPGRLALHSLRDIFSGEGRQHEGAAGEKMNGWWREYHGIRPGKSLPVP
jgi:hypothetical protein